MKRRFLFPAVAMTAWAQQQPAPVASEAEQALRARVQQFYQLQVDKKFRQSESMIAEDSKDDFYNSAKPDIKEFSIQNVQLSDNDTRAKVTLRGKFEIRASFGSQVFEMNAVSFWKIENGQWCWYVYRAPKATPFGEIAPANTAKGPVTKDSIPLDFKSLMNQVTVDIASVTLTSTDPVQKITVSNNLPGPIQLELQKPVLEGVSVEIDKSDLKSGEKSTVTFRSTGSAKKAGVVTLVASPLKKTFDITVHLN